MILGGKPTRKGKGKGKKKKQRKKRGWGLERGKGKGLEELLRDVKTSLHRTCHQRKLYKFRAS